MSKEKDGGEDKISIHCTDDVDDKVGMVMRQTDYTDNQARERLAFHKYDVVNCVKEFMGIPTEKKKDKIVSLNQQIYKEIRHKLGSVDLPTSDSLW